MVGFIFKYRFFFITILALTIVVLILKPFTAPSTFPTQSIVVIEEGVSLFELADKLEHDQVIRSPFWFRLAAILMGGEHRMKAGEYYMLRPQNVFTLAWRVLQGRHDIATVKMTIPEGFSNAKISALFDDRFTFFDNQVFLAHAPEGYLFPDTYFIPITATASSTIKLMRDNFDRKVSETVSPDVIIMASLLEAETNTQIDREMASDILWKRLKLGMPLQVDSYMWTYEFTGLPEKPINNPGTNSINAALHPTTTPYLYFLTGDDGEMYYAKTFEEHKVNKMKHLSQKP